MNLPGAEAIGFGKEGGECVGLEHLGRPAGMFEQGVPFRRKAGKGGGVGNEVDLQPGGAGGLGRGNAWGRQPRSYLDAAMAGHRGVPSRLGECGHCPCCPSNGSPLGFPWSGTSKEHTKRT